MSETLSAHEAEDVLASIRRLVSQEPRPGSVSMVLAPSEGADEERQPLDETPLTPSLAGENKLLLTSSFRVVPAPLTPPALAGQDLAASEDGAQSLARGERDLSAEAAALAARFVSGNEYAGATTREAEPSVEFAAPEPFRVQVAQSSCYDEEPEGDSAPPSLRIVRAVAISAEPEPVAAIEEFSWGDEEDLLWSAQLGAIANDAEAPRPEDMLTTVIEDAVDAELGGAISDAVAASMDALSPTPTPKPTPGPGLLHAEATVPMSALGAEFTPPVPDWMQAEAEWDDDEPAQFVPYPRAQPVAEEPSERAWADQAEAEVRAELEADAPLQDYFYRVDGEGGDAQSAPRVAQPLPDIFPQEETFLDEDMLRDMVREIIREELAGQLGERITRNIRKLVRVEVSRALTAREFG